MLLFSILKVLSNVEGEHITTALLKALKLYKELRGFILEILLEREKGREALKKYIFE